MRATLPKREKLCSRREIEELLKLGKSYFCYPFKVSCILYKDNSTLSIGEPENTSLPTIEEFPIKIVVSVPKRNFKRAVKRNLLKRRIREAYRLNKKTFTPPSGYRLNILFVYTAKEVLEYSYIEKKLISLSNKLQDYIKSESQELC